MSYKRCLFLVILYHSIPLSICININLFEFTVPTSRGIQNELCRKHSEFYLSELKNGAIWASKMFDSSSKVPSGIVYGSSHDFGHYDECIGIRESTEVGEIRGKYCRPSVEIIKSNITTSADTEAGSPKIWDYLMSFSDKQYNRPRNIIHWASCIPSSCNGDDLEVHLAEIVKRYENPEIRLKVHVPNDFCEVREEVPYEWPDLIFLGAVTVIVCSVLFATFYEYYMLNHASNPTAFHKIVHCFSISTNYKKLITLHPDPDNLQIIHGLRVISTFITVIFHFLIMLFGDPIHNLDDIEYIHENGVWATLLNMHTFIDTFFVITAFLTAYMLFEDLRTNRPFNYTRFIIHRIVRFTPLYVLTIAFNATIFSKLNDGPFWGELINLERDKCRDNWWTNMLYISNYVNTDRICLTQSWFLSASMQMVLITPLIVMFIHKRPRIGCTLLLTTIFGFSVITFVETYYRNLNPTLIFNTNIRNTSKIDTFTYGYIPTHTRASPFLIGILMAYLRIKVKAGEIKLPKNILHFGFVVSSVTTIVMMFWANTYYSRVPSSQLEAAAFATLHHIVIGYGISLTIFSASCGYTPIHLKPLQSKTLVPYSKITYSVNMCNFSIFFYIVASSRLPIFINTQYMIWNLMSNTIFTYLIGFILYLFFEAPFINLDRFFYRSGPRIQISEKTLNKSE